MKAFMVSVNGKRLWTVGIGPHGVLSVIFSFGEGPGHVFDDDFHFHIGGLDSRSGEHVKWDTPILKAGDSVSVNLVEVKEFDTETSRKMIHDTPNGKKPRPKSKDTARIKAAKAKPKREIP
jgi:hypothetical protein